MPVEVMGALVSAQATRVAAKITAINGFICCIVRSILLDGIGCRILNRRPRADVAQDLRPPSKEGIYSPSAGLLTRLHPSLVSSLL